MPGPVEGQIKNALGERREVITVLQDELEVKVKGFREFCGGFDEFSRENVLKVEEMHNDIVAAVDQIAQYFRP